MTIKLLGGPQCGEVIETQRGTMFYPVKGGSCVRSGKLTKEDYPIFEFVPSHIEKARRQKLIEELLKPCKRKP